MSTNARSFTDKLTNFGLGFWALILIISLAVFGANFIYAAYLNNPKPSYPAISKRMGEQGKVVLRVLIGTDGLPQKVEINKSSGFERLDRQAQEAVMRWRFVPGKRNGVPETMWNLVPVNFVLE